MKIERSKLIIIGIMVVLAIGVGIMIYQGLDHPLLGKWELMSIDNLPVSAEDESFVEFKWNGNLILLEDEMKYEVLSDTSFNMIMEEEIIENEYMLYDNTLIMRTFYEGTDPVQTVWEKIE